MTLILPRRGILSYPAGRAAGIDLSHVAAKGIRFSGVATSGVGGFIDILNGRKPSSSAGTPSSRINAQGPAATFPGTTDSLLISGQDASTQTNGTVAAIVQFDSFASFNAACATNSSNTGSGLTLFQNSGVVLLRVGSTNAATTIPLVAGVPYFIAASADKTTGVLNAVARRLDTGAVFYATSTPAITADAFESDGSFVVGNWPGGGLSAGGGVCAAMHARSFLSISNLLAWSADPWAFWYPNKTINLTSGSGAAATFLAAWASNSNLPVLGTGTY